MKFCKKCGAPLKRRPKPSGAQQGGVPGGNPCATQRRVAPRGNVPRNSGQSNAAPRTAVYQGNNQCHPATAPEGTVPRNNSQRSAAPQGKVLCDNKRRNQRIAIGVLSGVACVVALYVVLLISQKPAIEHAAETWWQVPEDATPAPTEGESTSLDNGDVVYDPVDANCKFDEETCTIYYPDMLIAYTTRDLSSSEADSLASKVQGKVVGDISGSLNVLQIQVEESDLKGLESAADTLMQSSDVSYACIDFPHIMEIDDATPDGNPWSTNGKPASDRGNEDSPGGNDWWAEAIGAYTAWNANANLNPVRVGVIDNWFLPTQEDIASAMVPCANYPNNVTGSTNHGTSVASLIGARGDNNVGLRGVADQSQIEYISFETYNGFTHDPHTNEVSGRIDSGEYIEMVKSLIDDGCRVINCSWGEHYYSYEKYKDKYIYHNSSFQKYIIYENPANILMPTSITDEDKREQAYEEYLDWRDTYQRLTATECILNIADWHQTNNDFIIVQSAGNGIDNGEGNEGVDARANCYFCGVEESVFDALPQSERDSLSSKGIIYQTIKNHIIIVSSTSNKKKDGKYRKCQYANSGPTVDIYAPGGRGVYFQGLFWDIFAASSGSDDSYTTSFGGTSAAAPIVTGCVAYIWSTNNDLTYDEVKSLLLRYSEPAIMDRNGETSEIRTVNIGNFARSLNTQSTTTQGQDTNHTNNAQVEELDNTPTSPSTNNDTNSTSNASTVSDRQAVAEAFCKQYFTQWSYDGDGYTIYGSNTADAALKYLKRGSSAWDAYMSSDEDYSSPLYNDVAGFVTDVRSSAIDDHTFQVVIDAIWIQNDPSYFTWDELQQNRNQNYFLVTVDDDCMITDIQVSSRGSVGAAQSGNG